VIAATRHWSEAIRLCRLAGATDVEAQALARRGEAYRAEGHLRDANSDLRAALAKAEQSNDLALIAASSGALGNLAFTSRRTAVAEPLLQRSRDLATRLRDPAITAASENDLGNLYASTGRSAEAAAPMRTRLPAPKRRATTPSPPLPDECGAARLAPEGYGECHGTVDAGGRHARALPASYHRSMAWSGGLGRVQQGPIAVRAVAFRAFRAAAETAEALHNPGLSSLAQGSLAHLYERDNRLDEASSLTERAAFAAQQASAPELSFRWNWQRARLAHQRGQTDLALTSYRRAVAALESVRQDIPVEYRDGRSSYRTTFGPVYLEFGDLLLRRASSDPVRAAGLIREARDTIELLKVSELQDYFRDPASPVSSQTALDRDHRSGYRRALSGCAARSPRAPGQLRRRAAAVHLGDTGSEPARRGPALSRIAGEAYDERVPGPGPAALRPDRWSDRAGPGRPSHRYSGYRARLRVACDPVCGIA
jgi:tetratricopeptide (TPR) repeat protein